MFWGTLLGEMTEVLWAGGPGGQCRGEDGHRRATKKQGRKRGWLWTAFIRQETSTITQEAETCSQAGHNYKMHYLDYSKGRCET